MSLIQKIFNKLKDTDEEFKKFQKDKKTNNDNQLINIITEFKNLNEQNRQKVYKYASEINSADEASTDDFEEKIKPFKPVNVSNMKTTFKSIKGNDKAKNMMREAYVHPTNYPKLFPIKTKGVLLYGPPGTGKTLLAKACANELKNVVHFFRKQHHP